MIFSHPLMRQRQLFWLRSLALLVILGSFIVSCSSSNEQANSHPTTGIAGVRRFGDTWNNIHLFQTFDYNISNQTTIAKRYDFVWGARLKNITAWRSGNPNIFLSYYLPFHREQGTFSGAKFLNSSQEHDLDYWKATHPDWILYQCDRTTPAYEFGDPNIPLDFANPNVISWQVETYAQPASTNGYDGIAADNVSMQNQFGACGSYKNGQWVQRYSGQSKDAQWRADIVNWLKQMQQALHQLKHPLTLISNLSFTSDLANDPEVNRAISYSDGVLDEGGFTHYGSNDLSEQDWLQKNQFIEKVQKQQKAYYLIEELPSTDHAELQWALASYLIGKGRMTALFISGIDDYGDEHWYSEYNAQIGSPKGSMYRMQNIYARDYSHGLSIVNPSTTETYTVTFNSGISYMDLYGNAIGQIIEMPPHSGMILLTHS